MVEVLHNVSIAPQQSDQNECYICSTENRKKKRRTQK